MIAGQASESGGYCLITSAESEGLGYVFVAMNAPGEDRKNDGTRSFPAGNAYTDIKSTVEWTTTTFGYVEIVEEGEIVGELPVKTAGDNTDHVNFITKASVDKLLPKNVDMADVVREIKLKYEELEAPVEKNMEVGTLVLRYDGKEIASVSLVTANEVERSKLLDIFDKFKNFLHSSFLKTVIRVLLIGLVCYLIFLLGCFVYRIIIKSNANAQKKARAKQREQAKKQALDAKNGKTEKKK